MHFTLRRIIFLAAIFLFSNRVFATPVFPHTVVDNVSINGVMSGDGFGWKQNATVGIRFGKRISVFGGPVFYGKEPKPSSSIFGAKYCLMREKESFCKHASMGAVFSVEQFKNVGLSTKCVEVETMGNQSKTDVSGVLNSLEFSGMEYSAGIDFIYRFEYGFIFHSEASFAYYSSQQQAASEFYTLRSNNGFSLRLGAGIGMEFGNDPGMKISNRKSFSF
jgi:hypothetical protein